MHLADVAEVGGGHVQGGEFALRTGGGLQRDGGQAGDFGEESLHLEQEFEHPLGGVVVLQGVQIGEPGQRCEPFVPLRVVLHGTRPERVEVGVDRHIPGRQVGKVPDQIDLAHLWERRRCRSALPVRDQTRLSRRRWHITRWEPVTSAPGVRESKTRSVDWVLFIALCRPGVRGWSVGIVDPTQLWPVARTRSP
jgi:hypothetical protein